MENGSQLTFDFWVQENHTESIETGLECPSCGSELLIDGHSARHHTTLYHDVECSNDECNYKDRIYIR